MIPAKRAEPAGAEQEAASRFLERVNGARANMAMVLSFDWMFDLLADFTDDPRADPKERST